MLDSHIPKGYGAHGGRATTLHQGVMVESYVFQVKIKKAENTSPLWKKGHFLISTNNAFLQSPKFNKAPSSAKLQIVRQTSTFCAVHLLRTTMWCTTFIKICQRSVSDTLKYNNGDDVKTAETTRYSSENVNNNFIPQPCNTRTLYDPSLRQTYQDNNRDTDPKYV